MPRVSTFAFLAGLLACAAGLLLPAAAGAASDWYASPAPAAGADCSQADPCGLSAAVGEARPGDTVIVGPGDYGSPSSPRSTLYAEGISIRGESARSRPRLFIAAPGSSGVEMSGAGASISDIEIDQSASSAPGLTMYGSESAERVIVRSAGPACMLKQIGASAAKPVIRDSLCLASSSESNGSSGVETLNASNAEFDPTLENVTAYASGANVGIVVESGSNSGTGSTTVHAVDVIARGGGFADISTISYTTAVNTVEMVASNYDPSTDYTGHSGDQIIDGGGNQSTAPSFVDAAGGDYREAAGSPTIDAGRTYAGQGALDLAGNSRVIGSAPDIGAYEWVPVPVSTTLAASGLSAGRATLNGAVANMDGAGAEVLFEYGTSTSYGQSTPVQRLGAGGAAQPVSATISGLAAGQTYHFRVMARNGTGPARGADQTFTTTAAAVPATPTASTTPPSSAKPTAIAPDTKPPVEKGRPHVNRRSGKLTVRYEFPEPGRARLQARVIAAGSKRARKASLLQTARSLGFGGPLAGSASARAAPRRHRTCRRAHAGVHRHCAGQRSCAHRHARTARRRGRAHRSTHRGRAKRRCRRSAAMRYGPSRTLTISTAGTDRLQIGPSRRARAALRRAGSLKVRLTLVFIPAGTTRHIRRTTRVKVRIAHRHNHGRRRRHRAGHRRRHARDAPLTRPPTSDGPGSR